MLFTLEEKRHYWARTAREKNATNHIECTLNAQLLVIFNNHKISLMWSIAFVLYFTWILFSQGTKVDNSQDSFDDKSIDERTPVREKKIKILYGFRKT